jgi:hypothetical protein
VFYCKRYLNSFDNLVLVAQASGAQVEPFWLAVYHDGDRVDIGHPAAVGVPLGVADIMTELRSFSA